MTKKESATCVTKFRVRDSISLVRDSRTVDEFRQPLYMSPVRDSMSQVRELLRSSIELLITYLDHAFGCQFTWPKKIRVRDACLKFVTAESLMRTDTPRYTRLNRVIQCLNLVIRSVKFVVELPITKLDYELGRNCHNKKKIQDRDPYLKFVTVEPLMRTDKPLYVHS